MAGRFGIRHGSPYSLDDGRIGNIQEYFAEGRRREQARKEAARKRALALRRQREFIRQERKLARGILVGDFLAEWQARLGLNEAIASIVEIVPDPRGAKLAEILRRDPNIAFREALIRAGISPAAFIDLVRAGKLAEAPAKVFDLISDNLIAIIEASIAREGTRSGNLGGPPGAQCPGPRPGPG